MPERARCEELGRQLTLKYPFIKDDFETGYVSHALGFTLGSCTRKTFYCFVYCNTLMQQILCCSFSTYIHPALSVILLVCIQYFVM